LTNQDEAPVQRKNTKKKVIALALAFLLLLLAGYYFLTRPQPAEPAPPAAVPVPDTSAQDEWFATLKQLQTISVPEHKCATFTQQTVNIDGYSMTADKRVEGEYATFLFSSQPTDEQLFPVKGEGIAFEQCAIQLTDVYVEREGGVFSPDMAVVESKLNAMGYTNDEYNTAYTLAPMVNLTMDTNAADSFRVEISNLPQFTGEVKNGEDGSTTVSESPLLSIPFVTDSDAPAEELAELHNRISDEDYELLTAYAQEVIQSASSD
jgi:hypothetical protein